jgi:hypothetical protein
MRLQIRPRRVRRAHECDKHRPFAQKDSPSPRSGLQPQHHQWRTTPDPRRRRGNPYAHAAAAKERFRAPSPNRRRARSPRARSRDRSKADDPRAQSQQRKAGVPSGRPPTRRHKGFVRLCFALIEVSSWLPCLKVKSEFVNIKAEQKFGAEGPAKASKRRQGARGSARGAPPPRGLQSRMISGDWRASIRAEPCAGRRDATARGPRLRWRPRWGARRSKRNAPQIAP